MIASPEDLAFAKRVAQAERLTRDATVADTSSSRGTDSVAGASAPRDAISLEAIGFAIKRLRSIRFSPSGPREKILLHPMSSAGPSGHRVLPGLARMFQAHAARETQRTAKAESDLAIATVDVMGPLASLSGGVAYSTPVGAACSDRVHLSLREPRWMSSALSNAGRLFSASASDSTAQTVGQAEAGSTGATGAHDAVAGHAFALLHESAHQMQWRDALARNHPAFLSALKIGPRSAGVHSALGLARERIDRAITEKRRNPFDRGVSTPSAPEGSGAIHRKVLLGFISIEWQRVEQSNVPPAHAADGNAQSMSSEEKAERKEFAKRQRAAEREAERRETREQRLGRSLAALLGECFADSMASFAMGEGRPREVALALRAAATWRDTCETPRDIRAALLGLALRALLPWQGDPHQTQDAVRHLAALCESLPDEARPSAAQWAEAARASAVAGSLDWALRMFLDDASTSDPANGPEQPPGLQSSGFLLPFTRAAKAKHRRRFDAVFAREILEAWGLGGSPAVNAHDLRALRSIALARAVGALNGELAAPALSGFSDPATA